MTTGINFLAVQEHFNRRAQASKHRQDPVLWAQDRVGAFLWSKQQEILRALTTSNVAVKTTFSVGKMLPLDTPIPTPQGWTTMGDLAPGDQVLGQDGRPTTVTFVSPTQLGKMYELTFGDGSTLVACAEHQWNTLTTTKRRAIKDRRRKNNSPDWREHWDSTTTLTTQQIVDTLTISSGQARHAIPTAKPLDLPHNPDLPWHPYILGAWLGDGGSSAPNLFVGDDGQHIIDEFGRLGHTLVSFDSDPCGYSFAGSAPRGQRVNELRQMGVYRNKHIPMQYLRASEQQRRDLLRGIMDTDGFSIRQGTVGIDLMNHRLALDVAELVRSLGYKTNVKEGRATITQGGVRRDVGVRYRLAWTMDTNPFTSGGHKHAAFTPASAAARRRTTLRTIVAAREVDPTPSRCISVDNEYSLYLAGEDFIPTHNTYCAALASTWWVDTQGEDALVVSTAPTFRQINSLLWEEMRRFHANHGLKGEILQQPKWTTVTTSGAKVISGLGIKPADNSSNNTSATEMTALQGLHRTDGILAVIDEAAGVSEAIFAGIERVTTSPKDRILALCNPTDSSSYFARLWKERPKGWTFITISAFDSPNFTGEYVPPDLSTSLPQVDWVEQRRVTWGEDSHRWKSEILAEWTDSAVDGLFNLSHVDHAIRNVHHEPDPAPSASNPRRLGVDVGHRGGDSTVVVLYEPAAATATAKVSVVGEWQGEDTVTTAQKVLELAGHYEVDEVRVDAIGVGAGVFDQLLRTAPSTMLLYEMKGNNASPNFDRWYNARAYWYDSLRQNLADSLLDLPDYKRLKEEFAVIKYELRGPSMLIMSKEDMRRKGIKSPDVLDAVVYACAELPFEDGSWPLSAPGEEDEGYDEYAPDDMLVELAPF